MSRLFRLLLIAFSLSLSSLAFADTDDFLINRIHLQLNAEKWVTTQTALVSVSVNASVQSQGVDKITAMVKEHLKKISASGNWNITSLQRSQEKSGLESLQIHAEARLPQNELSDLRDRAKLVSTPGQTFNIDSIIFKPSDEDVRTAETELRHDIYVQAKAEIDRLNKIYPDQKYYLHAIDFNAGPRPMPMQTMALRADMGPMGRESKMATVSSSDLDIGNKRELTASVIIGSLADTTRKGLPPNL